MIQPNPSTRQASLVPTVANQIRRGELVRVTLAGRNQVFGSAWTSSVSVIREAMHDALDAWIDATFLETYRQPRGRQERETWIEVMW
jgi:hypothetical protein